MLPGQAPPFPPGMPMPPFPPGGPLRLGGPPIPGQMPIPPPNIPRLPGAPPLPLPGAAAVPPFPPSLPPASTAPPAPPKPAGISATVVPVPTPKPLESNPEMKEGSRLVWDNHLKSAVRTNALLTEFRTDDHLQEEVRADHAKYNFEPPRSSWIQAGTNEAGGDDGKGRKRARAEDFI